jgi:N-acetylmuramoyl-L-alanine amidase
VPKKLKWGIIVLICVLLFVVVKIQFWDNSSWQTWSLPLSGKVIVIDPGHGGPDGGAVGGDVIEKDISLAISLQLRDYLQEAGAVVYMTRENDKDLAGSDTSGLSRRKSEDLKARANLINNADADFFVSIHLNAIPSSKWRGAQVFYHPSLDESEKASKFIQDEIRDVLKNTNRLAKPIKNVYLLRASEIPGSLVEVGFLSNPDERSLLQSDEYQDKMAATIYRGILRYFTNEPVPSS